MKVMNIGGKVVSIGNVIILPGDVADPDDCNRFVQATIDHYGRCKPVPVTANLV